MSRTARSSQRGVALTFVVILLVVLSGLSAVVANFYFNKKKLESAGSGKNIKVYYLAKAGVVEAYWRIRSNTTTGLSPAGSFTTDAYNPNPYSIDVNGDGTNDCTVDIGPADAATKARQIISTGLDL